VRKSGGSENNRDISTETGHKRDRATKNENDIDHESHLSEEEPETKRPKIN